uniref:Uncharacterized protein n=1 Tax=Tanacetum cinerariifolium TaxID=118510 RepID=A0A699HUT6_TANCI|nr:hypothetical protein [Tanacetum cinerariifolium]
MAFMSSSNKNNTNGPVNTAQAVNTAIKVSTASTQVNTANIDNLSDVVICAFLSDQAEDGLNFALMAYTSSSLDSKSKKPKEVRKNTDALIIKEWVFNDEDEEMIQAKFEHKTVKTSIAKIEFVKRMQPEKKARKTVKQIENPRQNTHRPRGNLINWNNMMSQRLGRNFEMLNKACKEVKNASTPMKTQKPLLKDEDGDEVDIHMYRSMIGSLMYLTSSRPDIMFAVRACARYQVNPKLIHKSIINGPYVRRMIPELGDTNREVPVNETFHVQTDDELIEKELIQIEADDQAIQTILLGLPEDIYAAVDSYETAQEIWLRVQQMMKGSDIEIQEKKA